MLFILVSEIYLTPNQLSISIIHVCDLLMATIMVTKRPWTIKYNIHTSSVSEYCNYLNYWCCIAGMELRVENLITKVVITMVTKRPCIPVAHVNGFSGMHDIHFTQMAILRMHTTDSNLCHFGVI